MAKGDESIVLIDNEVTNLLSNSNMRHFQYDTFLAGTSALGSNLFDYKAADRFVWARNGAASGNDTFVREAAEAGLAGTKAEYIMSLFRGVPVAGNNLVGGQKIESIFAKRAVENGKMSFHKLLRVYGGTESVTMSFSYANAKDDFSSTTEFFSQTYTKGVELPDGQLGEYGEIKIEDVTVPPQAANGIYVQASVDGDGVTAAVTLQYKTTLWQCNPGSKALSWRLMMGNDIGELPILQRYFEKSHDTDDSINAPDFTEEANLPIGRTNLNGLWANRFRIPKRTIGYNFQAFHPQTGAANTVRQFGGTNYGVSYSQLSQVEVQLINNSGLIMNPNTYSYYWTCRAEL